MAQMIRKQSLKPSASLNDIIAYQDMQRRIAENHLLDTSDLKRERYQEFTRASTMETGVDCKRQESSGTTVYEILRGSPDVGESESYECEGEDIQSDKSCEEFLNSGSECEESDQTDGGTQDDSSFSVATSPDLCFVSASNDPIQRPHSSDLYPSSSLTQAISDKSLDTVAENEDSEKEKVKHSKFTLFVYKEEV